jgi:predicted GNAT superfamily acetyltransferase
VERAVVPGDRFVLGRHARLVGRHYDIAALRDLAGPRRGVARPIPVSISRHDITVREMTETDVDDAAAINAACTPEVGEADTPALSRLLSMSAVALVAECRDHGTVGFCIVLPPDTDYDSPNYLYFTERHVDFVYLDRIAVDPGHRNLGIGTALHAGLLEATTAGLVTLEINLDPSNTGSLRFHERLDFVEVERLETRPGKPVSLQIRRRGAERIR